MAEYVKMIVASSFFVTVISSLLPCTQSGKNTKLALKVLVLIVIIAPVIKFFGGNIESSDINVINPDGGHIITSEEKSDRTYEKFVAKITARQLEDKIKDAIYEKFGENVRVKVPVSENENGITFGKIIIYTDSKSDISSYVSLIFGLDSVCIKE